MSDSFLASEAGGITQAPGRSHILRETLLLALTFTVAMAGAVAGVWWMARNRSVPPEPERLAVQPAEAIGHQPAGTGKFTLVEFMDYQCPPCRANADPLDGLIERNQGRVELVVRNFPLRMHDRAETAAAAAEAGRQQGKFAEMHRGLLTAQDLSDAGILKIAKAVGVDVAGFNRSWRGAAKTRVATDKKSASKLGIESTPTFLLCTPKGEVWRLSNLKQAQRLVTPGAS